MEKENPKGGTYIGDASDDVLYIIFSNLSSVEMSKLAQAHPRFQFLILRLLYRSIRLEVLHMGSSDYSSLGANELPPGLEPVSLSSSLEKYPSLRKHVRSLSLKVHSVSWYENPNGHERLMKLLPSIQQISLNPPPKEYRFYTSDQLTTMKLDFSYDLARFWSPNRLIDATPFDAHNYLLLPKLNRLQFENDDPVYYAPLLTRLPEKSTVTDIRFINWSPERVRVLNSVIPSCTDLKHFVLETNHSGHRFNHPLGPQHYGLLLEPYSASLESLIIAYSDGAYNDGEGFPPQSPLDALPAMGPLTNYHHLKRLVLPETLLAHPKGPSFHKYLPPQLEELQIQYHRGIYRRVLDKQGDSLGAAHHRLLRMQKLAKHKDTLVPRLRHVVWWFQQTWAQVVSLAVPETHPRKEKLFRDSNATRLSDDPRKGLIFGPLGDMDELVERFAKVGVRFEWCSVPTFDDTPFAKYSRIP